jgi:transcription initiation factor TFIID TATA-box-binding protein
MTEFEVNVENVVAFTSLGKDVSLQQLVEELEGAEYEPEQFPGLVYRIKNPRAASLIFSSGKIVCTGAKSIDLAKVAMRKVVDDMRALGIKLPTKFDIKVENIVASSKIDAQLNLEEIAVSLENAEYEPEQFPGLVYRIREPRVAFLLFSSGKIICTGSQSLADVHKALVKLKEKLKEIGVEMEESKKEPEPGTSVKKPVKPKASPKGKSKTKTAPKKGK